MRSRFLLAFLMAFPVAAGSPARAQINGVPASVTSLGFGGSNNPNPGVRASVTSLGPNGFGSSRPFFGDCCLNFFLPASLNPPLFFDRQFSDRQFSGRHRRHEDHPHFVVGVYEPAYTPYAVPYDAEADDDSPDFEYVYAAGPRRPEPRARHAAGRDPASKAEFADKAAPGEPEEPVAAQPSTVLVFKDGHHSDVLNYAIVGDTLFDFAPGHTRKILLADLDLPTTHKVNDDRGVDFQIPPSSSPR